MTTTDYAYEQAHEDYSPGATPSQEKKADYQPQQSVSSGYNSVDILLNQRTHYGQQAESTSSGESKTNDVPKRVTWSSKVDFMLTIVGFTVDLANIWRFPYLAYQNGGGAFLIPYLTCLILAVFPLFYLELCLGQFHRLGAISVWKIAPLFKGLGYAITIIIFWVGLYYTVVITWGFYYLFHSFSAVLPWTSCNNTYNTERCWDGDPNATFPDNVTRVPAAREFFERYVVGVHESSGLHELGVPNWHLCLTNLLLFIILYFIVWKGVKASGKVVWVTATLPFLILGALFIRGLLLPGAWDGIKFLIIPDVEKIADPTVWIQAAIQVFFSAGVGLGTHIAYGSYNEFNNNCYRDSVITTICNTLSSVFSGLVIFSYLGYMALRQGVPISEVAAEGPGLVFCVYPEAISTLPGAQVWSVAFFAMLIMLGMDSSMGSYESVVTALVDEHSFFKRRRYGRELLLALFMIPEYILTLACLTSGGYYLIALFDAYAAGLSMLFVALFELLAVAWFYGLDHFCEDMRTMLGKAPSIYWRICWKLVSPTFILGLIAILIKWSTVVVVETSEHVYEFPMWATGLGWLVTCSSLAAIPLVAVITYRRQPATSVEKKMAMLISPEWDHQSIKSGRLIRRYDCRHWFSLGGKFSDLQHHDEEGDRAIACKYTACALDENGHKQELEESIGV